MRIPKAFNGLTVRRVCDLLGRTIALDLLTSQYISGIGHLILEKPPNPRRSLDSERARRAGRTPMSGSARRCRSEAVTARGSQTSFAGPCMLRATKATNCSTISRLLGMLWPLWCSWTSFFSKLAATSIHWLTNSSCKS